MNAANNFQSAFVNCNNIEIEYFIERRKKCMYEKCITIIRVLLLVLRFHLGGNRKSKTNRHSVCRTVSIWWIKRSQKAIHNLNWLCKFSFSSFDVWVWMLSCVFVCVDGCFSIESLKYRPTISYWINLMWERERNFSVRVVVACVCCLMLLKVCSCQTKH